MANNFIFVGGAPRSGTTLVQRILLSHPAITGGAEFSNIQEIVKLYNRIIYFHNEGRIDNITSVDNIKKSFVNFIKNLFYELDKNDEFIYISEKTPSNIDVFNELMDISDNYRFVFVLRNPFDIIASMLEVGKGMKKKKIKPIYFTRNIINATNYTYNCINKGVNLSAKFSNKVILVKYEDVIINKEREAKKMFEFLNLNSVDAINSTEITDSKLDSRMKYDDIWYSKEKFGNNIMQNRMGQGILTLKKYQQYIILRKFKENINIYNEYEFTLINNKINILSIILGNVILLIESIKLRVKNTVKKIILS